VSSFLRWTLALIFVGALALNWQAGCWYGAGVERRRVKAYLESHDDMIEHCIGQMRALDEDGVSADVRAKILDQLIADYERRSSYLKEPTP
jgi:hypothetical protein